MRGSYTSNIPASTRDMAFELELGVAKGGIESAARVIRAFDDPRLHGGLPTYIMTSSFVTTNFIEPIQPGQFSQNPA